VSYEVVTVMNWYGGGMGWGGWLVMGGFWLVLLAFIVFLVVRLLPSSRPPTSGGSVESPEDILDRRFALGEVDEASYTAQRAALAKHRGERR
jgi:putative membrane protein